MESHHHPSRSHFSYGLVEGNPLPYEFVEIHEYYNVQLDSSVTISFAFTLTPIVTRTSKNNAIKIVPMPIS